MQLGKFSGMIMTGGKQYEETIKEKFLKIYNAAPFSDSDGVDVDRSEEHTSELQSLG